MEPASIRYRNPGAMWGNAVAVKWGAQKKAVALNDGKGQGNNIAVFPTYVQGICAQLDLWRSSKNYRNKSFADAIAIWSGHNEVESYINYVLARVPGMTRDTIMDDEFWTSPMGVAFLKAQAGHEAGRKYPAPDADWIEAQRCVLAGVLPRAADPDKKPLMSSKIMQGATGTAVSIGTAIASKTAEHANTETHTVSISDIAEKVQQANDTVTTIKTATDGATAIVQTMKPFLGLDSSTWAAVAVTAVLVAGVFIAFTMWERHKKLRDQGV